MQTDTNTIYGKEWVRILPDYVLNALFVMTGLLLLNQIYALLPAARRRGTRAVLHGVGGMAALFTANTLGSLAGVGIGLNEFTLPVSAVLGVPGVALLWGIKYLL